MGVIFRISIRNLLEHRGKTLIIGTIIAIGVITIIVGNSMMDTAAEGIRNSFIENYTGHVMVTGVADGDISLFGVLSVGGIEDTPSIPNYDDIRAHVESLPEVEEVTSQVSGIGLVRIDSDRVEGLEYATPTMLYGIEPDTYERMFNSIEVVEGRFLAPGERGIMISRSRVDDMIQEFAEGLVEGGISDREIREIGRVEVNVGDPIRIVSGFQQGLPRIRVVPIVAIYEPRNQGDGVGSELVSFIDVQTQRSLQGLTIGFTGDFDLPEETTRLLDSLSEESFQDTDSLFGDNLFADSSFDDDPFEIASLDDIFASIPDVAGDGPSVEVPGSGEPVLNEQIDTGAWQYILLRLRNPGRTNAVIRDLNEWFEEQGYQAQAANWEAAAGPFATTADVIRIVFNIAIIIVGVVAIIIMVNTLVISVVERTAEIGTMRALGAQQPFVWKLFATETLTIAIVFGIIGIILALLIILALNIIAFPATNSFLRILFAGEALRPAVSIPSLFYSLIVVSVVGFLAHIYPVRIALKIQPVRAMQSD